MSPESKHLSRALANASIAPAISDELVLEETE